ncbi:type III secretion system outer membrane ring subunit SctC [Limnobacter parvus]|uniref:Type III secretion system outer membrane ring subunit SctC n=1 Tax=Limnobacter parvus TaxID=2939690 RepID=A0ABT1XIY1_9BURK|nr:type III secretion system outer membrane ring subunit SctC [Limnobacter parvus]MCR2747240.1 type III secretion system outer membrane ring subunit SctC [Limnobacter parvus]
MKSPHKLLSGFVIACAVLFGPISTVYSQAKGDTKIYIAQGEGAKLVLRNLLSMFGKKLVADGLTSAPVSGRFEAKSVEDVMGYFQSAYQINWFQNGNTVYAYSVGDWSTKRLYVGGERSNDDWKQMIESAGLAYKEFNVVYSQDHKELLVAGPRSYLKLLESAFKQERPDPSEQDKYGIELMVFPLKHASVEDRITNLRGSSVVTPGALTVLLNLLNLPSQSMSVAPELKSQSSMKSRNNMPTGIVGMGDLAASQGNAGRMGQIADIGGAASKQDPSKEAALSVTSDPRTNAILIRDAKTKYSYYKTLIDQLDKPVQMVEIEAMLIEIDQRSLNQLGMEFGIISSRFGYDFPGDAVGRPNLVPRPNLIPGSNSIIDPAQFMVRLRALAADEQAKVLARPTIVTQDNVSAYIDLSQTLFLPVSGERVADVVEVTAGSLLQVTPRVVFENGDEKIFLRVEIQDGSLVNSIGQGIQTPQVQNTSLSTQALIHREKAILIGGYNRDSSEDKEYKVPGLSSLPFIGKVFTSTEKKSQTVARLFLITPKLVDGGALHDTQSTKSALDKMQMSFKIKEPESAPVPTLLKIDGSLRR